MAVSKRLRYEVLRRDNHACRYCGVAAPAVTLTVDHVIPRALGGTDAPTNLAAACPDCNGGKSSSSPLIPDVPVGAIETATAQRQMVEQFHTIWTRYWRVVGDQQRLYFPMPGDWRDTICVFHEYGLRTDDLGLLVKAAVYSDVPDVDVWTRFRDMAIDRVSALQGQR